MIPGCNKNEINIFSKTQLYIEKKEQIATLIQKMKLLSLLISKRYCDNYCDSQLLYSTEEERSIMLIRILKVM